MAPIEKRKNLRRSINYPAYIDLGDASPLRECSLCDASQEGAQLLVADPNGLPDDFILALSADGAARRHCRVVWRTKTQVGVEFLKGARTLPRPKASSAASRKAPGADPTRAAAGAAVEKIDIDTLSRP
jgi:hypothetical protein